MNGWISVEDQLPKFCEDVIISNGKKTFVAQLHHFGSHQPEFSLDGMYPCSGFTHWQPLPEPHK